MRSICYAIQRESSYQTLKSCQFLRLPNVFWSLLEFVLPSLVTSLDFKFSADIDEYLEFQVLAVLAVLAARCITILLKPKHKNVLNIS